MAFWDLLIPPNPLPAITGTLTAPINYLGNQWAYLNQQAANTANQAAQSLGIQPAQQQIQQQQQQQVYSQPSAQIPTMGAGMFIPQPAQSTTQQISVSAPVGNSGNPMNFLGGLITAPVETIQKAGQSAVSMVSASPLASLGAQAMGMIPFVGSSMGGQPDVGTQYNKQLSQYESDLKKYTAEGSTNEAEYNRLKGEENKLLAIKSTLPSEKPATTTTQMTTNELPGVNTPGWRPKPWIQSLTTGDIGGMAGSMSALTTMLTPKPQDIIDVIEKNPKVVQTIMPLGFLFTNPYTKEAAQSEVIRGIYGSAREHPMETLATYEFFKQMPVLESGGAGMLSDVAQQKFIPQGIPVISKLAGYASPITSKGAQIISGSKYAPDIYTIGTKGVLPGIYAVEKYGEVSSAPTEREKWTKLGEITKDIGLAGLGTMRAEPGEVVVNPYTSKEFSPLEVARQTIAAKINSFDIPASQKGAREWYTELPKIFRELRNKEIRPGITETTPAKPFEKPDISRVGGIGPERAPAIEKALAEEPHMIIGSATMEGQRTGLPTGEAIRTSPHDLDVRVDSKPRFDNILKKYGETSKSMDISEFEAGTPLIPGRTNKGVREGVKIISWGTRLFGEPIRNKMGQKLPYLDEMLLGGKDYPGIGNQEKANVLTARKIQASMQDMLPASAKISAEKAGEARAMNEEFRIPKDFYDTYTWGSDILAGENVATGKPWNTMTKTQQRLEKVKGVEWNYNFKARDTNELIGAKAGEVFNKKIKYSDTFQKYREAVRKERAAQKTGRTTGQKEAMQSESDVIESPPGYVERVSPFTSGYSGMSMASMIPSSIASFVQSPSGASGRSGYSSPSVPVYSPPTSPISPSIISIKSPGIPSIISIKSPGSPSITSPSSPGSPSYSSPGSPSITSPGSPGSPIYGSSYGSPKSPSIGGGGLVFGAPFLGLPGAGGEGGRYRAQYSKVIKNPLRGLVIASSATKLRFASTFGNVKSSLKAEPIKKGNLKLVNKFATPKHTIYKPKGKQNSNVRVNIDILTGKKKNKRGMAF